LHTLLVNKYYLDEFNERVLARGARGLGGIFWRIGDVAVIDGAMVNGSARLVGWMARVARHLQSGYLYHYAFAMIVGLSVLVGWVLIRG
jgi:NADH-quinone oxidoreductase subunit L